MARNPADLPAARFRFLASSKFMSDCWQQVVRAWATDPVVAITLYYLMTRFNIIELLEFVDEDAPLI